MAKFSRGPWHVAIYTTRAKKSRVEVRNGRADPIAIVYSSEDDARLMAAAPRLLSELKHLIAIVHQREGDLRASERASLERARALLAELT